MYIRFKKRNMILAAIWFSASKPTMSTFLRPLMDAINDICDRILENPAYGIFHENGV